MLYVVVDDVGWVVLHQLLVVLELELPVLEVQVIETEHVLGVGCQFVSSVVCLEV